MIPNFVTPIQRGAKLLVLLLVVVSWCSRSLQALRRGIVHVMSEELIRFVRELAVTCTSTCLYRADIGCLVHVSFLRRQVLGSLMLEFTTWFGPSRTRLLVLILTSVRTTVVSSASFDDKALTFSVQTDRCLTMGRAHGHLRAKVVALTEPQAAAALARRG